MNKPDKSDLEKLYQRRLLDAMQLGTYFNKDEWKKISSLLPISFSEPNYYADDDDSDPLSYFDYCRMFDDLLDELDRARKNKEDKIYLDVIRAALREFADRCYNCMLKLI